MRFCSLLCCVVLVFSFWLTAFSGMSASASVTTRQLTPVETRQLFGDTIPAKYFNGSDYVDFTFTYASTFSVSSVNVDGSTLVSQGDTVLIYGQSGSFNVNTNPSYITVDLRPEYSFFDTDYITQYCGLSTAGNVGNAVYSPPSWRWFSSFSGDMIFENQLTGANGSAYYATFTTSMSAVPFTFVEASLQSQSTFSAYSHRVLFYGNAASSGHLYLAVSCPVVSDDSTMASGTAGVTTGSASGSGDVNITVDVDMTETNGFLASILAALASLAESIGGLFLPDDDFMLDWLDRMHLLFRDHFGPLFDAWLTIESVFRSVIRGTPQAQTAITFGSPFVDPSGSGLDDLFTPAVWVMPLVPTGMQWLVDAFKDFQIIIYTIAFVNMLRSKLEWFLSPEHPDY